MVACSKPTVPTQFAENDMHPLIYPDYVGVTVPKNICPLNFAIEDMADDYVTRIKVGAREWIVGGQSVVIEENDWSDIKTAALQAKGRISIEVFICNEGKWTRMMPFMIHVSEDEIDPYISYRLIAPSYVTYEGLTINQRCLENYDETLIYGNMINTNEKDGQCINCHNYQNYDPNTMQFHVRQAHGGTVIAHDGQIEKVNMKLDGLTSAGVYPTWHPKEKLIVYSTNHTGQTFHTYDTQKVEVQDTYSDLILYDVDKHEVEPLEKDTNDLDCFPFWSPDGKYLYYCSAHYELHDSTGKVSKELDLINNYQDVHYNLYRRSFDLKTHDFGPREMVYNCGDTASATLPRISPDGRYLMFTRGKFGVFHIWHNSSDLYLMDLQARQTRCIDEINSADVESYHSWSSNGKWVIFSSRRYDGNFTRPFIAHMKADGTFERPFELPQADPRYHQDFLRSYNIPEFMKGPVTITPQQFAEIVINEPVNATLSKRAPKQTTDVVTGASQVKSE